MATVTITLTGDNPNILNSPIVLSNRPFLGATLEVGEPDHGHGETRSIWYNLETPSNNNITISVSSADFTPWIAVYRSTINNSAIEDLIPVVQGSSSVSFNSNEATNAFFKFAITN
jgi:hypothetical protein